MLRQEVISNFFLKSVSKIKKKYRNNKQVLNAIDNDLITIRELLITDSIIPNQFKDHKLQNTSYRELHLVSKGSDILLVYKKYYDGDIPILYLLCITDHKMLKQLSLGFILY